jgi:SPP1 gp7 family putative phage head morphogenesis protein
MLTKNLLNPALLSSIHQDPDFLSFFNDELPNPDPILKKLGIDQQIYEQIMMDNHIIGELRTVRSGFLSFEWQILPAGDSPADRNALELCQKILQTPPNENDNWPDILWQMATAVFFGYKFHEIVWERQNNYIIPKKIVDTKNKRFFFQHDGTPRIKTRAKPEGQGLDHFRFLLTRHMAHSNNPYGIALLSACYWPYLFKHNGFKYFVKFAERFSIPNAIGKYPAGTSEEQQENLLEQLSQMIESSVAVLSKEDDITLLETNNNSEIHTALINMCNREISKTLTSQTLATELQNSEGSRAAAETHMKKNQFVMESDRQMIVNTFNKLFEYITIVNFKGAQSPKFNFFEETEARLGWAEVFNIAQNYLEIPANFVYQRLQIPEPKNNESVIASKKNNFSIADFSAENRNYLAIFIDRFSKAFDDLFVVDIQNIFENISNFNSLTKLLNNFVELNKFETHQKMQQLIMQSLQLGQLLGIEQAQQERREKREYERIAIENVEFKEAIFYLKRKVNMPSKSWNDLKKETYDLSFVISEITKASFLTDIHDELVKSLKAGKTIKDFRNEFAGLVNKHGWTFKEEKKWRSDVIFDNNLHSARAAGKWKQYQKSEEKLFLSYSAVRDHRTRADHSMLHGTVRAINDSFWTHYYPPNGHRCRCTTISYDERQMSQHRIKETNIPMIAKQQKGIDTGFDYAPGRYIEQLKKQTKKMPKEIALILKNKIKTIK